MLLQVVGSVVGPGLWMLAGRPAAGRSCQQRAELFGVGHGRVVGTYLTQFRLVLAKGGGPTWSRLLVGREAYIVKIGGMRGPGGVVGARARRLAARGTRGWHGVGYKGLFDRIQAHSMQALASELAVGCRAVAVGLGVRWGTGVSGRPSAVRARQQGQGAAWGRSRASRWNLLDPIQT